MDDQKTTGRREDSGKRDNSGKRDSRDRAADVRAEIAKRRAEHSSGKHLKK